MAALPLPPIEFLRECFSYDPATGEFVWKTRPKHHFHDDARCNNWNSIMAGKPAFQTRCGKGYLRCEVVYEGRRVRLGAARVAFKLMTGEEPEMVDHINRQVDDNRFINLRASDNSKNQANTNRRGDRGLPKGVFLEGGRFVSRAYSANGVRKYLGTFKTPAEAHAAYRAHSENRYGEHFCPGDPVESVFD